MAYGLLGLLINLGLLVALMVNADATYRAKVLGAVWLGVALLLRYRLPEAQIVGILLQVSAGLWTALYLRYLAAAR